MRMREMLCIFHKCQKGFGMNIKESTENIRGLSFKENVAK